MVKKKTACVMFNASGRASWSDDVKAKAVLVGTAFAPAS